MQSRLIVLIATITCLFTVSHSIYAETSLDGFNVIAENEYLQLYLNSEIVEIAVLDKRSGDIWYSNPYDRDKKETIARGMNKERLNSQLVITYYLVNQRYQMDSFNDSVVHDQYEIVPISNGVRINYQFGRMWEEKDYLPTIISEERFNELILSRIPNEKDRTFLRNQYGLFSLEKGYDSGEDYSISGVDFDKLLGDYGLKVEEPKFRVTDKRRLFQEYLVLVRDAHKYESLGDVKSEQIAGLYNTPTLLLKWNVMQWDIDSAIEIVKRTGYTPEDAQYDHEMYSVEPPFPGVRRFHVSVEYTIDGPDLVVRIPSDSIKFPDKVYDASLDKEVTYPLTAISLLPYFGAADNDSEGYSFVPDGSGALIRFGNTKAGVEPYNRMVYGQDPAAVSVLEYSAMLKEQIYMPVFGIKNGNQAFLGIIEEGDAIARIEATTSGMRDSYNKVWTTFDVRPSARVNMEAVGELVSLRSYSINMYQAKPYEGDIAVRYSFLSGDQANYAGMAQLYQQYLVANYGLERIASDQPMPLVLDIIGSIDEKKPVLGLPMNVVEPLTTHEQALEIVNDLLDSGIENIKLRYLGWMQGGINHVFPTRASLEKSVGTKESWRILSEQLRAKEVEFFPSVDFMTVHRNSLFDGFIGFRDTSRSLSRSNAYINTYDIATYQPVSDKRISILSPARLSDVVGSFLRDYMQYGIRGLSSGDLGLLLYADYRTKPDDLVNRQTAKSIVVEQAERMKNEGLDLTLKGGNMYLIPYAKYLVNAPMYSRGIAILDYTVPFYQMVVSGYLGYAGAPYNLADRSGHFYVLKMMETGAIPYFAVSATESFVTKNTDFNNLYSIYYQDLVDDILRIYREVDEVLGEVWGMRIVNHEIVGPSVFKTVYEDGTTVFVNYTPYPYVVDEERVVPAEGYVVIK